MGTLTREQILSADDLPTQDVDVPEWGGSVTVRSMTGAERDAFEAGLMVEEGEDEKNRLNNLRARLCSLCIVDDDGVPLFSPEDVEALGKKSAAALDRVFTKAQTLNGLGAKDVEDLAKN
jgi:hypothetical protein